MIKVMIKVMILLPHTTNNVWGNKNRSNRDHKNTDNNHNDSN